MRNISISYPQFCSGRFSLSRWRAIDPRYFQIVILACLCAVGVVYRSIPISLLQLAISLVAALSAQWCCSRRVGCAFDWRSALITGFSLAILLRTNSLAWVAIAAVGAIVMKFSCRIQGRHVFNPANGIIVVLLLTAAPVWVSPGQWGASAYGVFLFAGLGLIVLNQTRQLDIALSFLISYAALLFARALYLGDGWQIPLHQLQNGAVLLFAFFMISDPKTIPSHWRRRAIFAASVALIAFWLQFSWHIREAIFYALFVVSVIFVVIRFIDARKSLCVNPHS